MTNRQIQIITTKGYDSADRRTAWGDYLASHEAKIRALIRKSLGDMDRGLSDTSDLYSTVLKRVDGMADRLDWRPRSEDEIWTRLNALIQQFANRARLETLRTRAAESDPAFGRHLEEVLSHPDERILTVLESQVQGLRRQQDRDIYIMMLRGVPHRMIAQALGITEEASRNRWFHLRRQLKGMTNGL